MLSDDRHERVALNRQSYELEFEEDFRASTLTPTRWVAEYLPHWSTPERSRARYDIRPGLLQLRIDADQPAWRPEDGEMRVSNLQTGTFSGPLGSSIGQHRHRPDLAVRTAYPIRRLYTPRYGLFEAIMSASPDPACMLAFWLVGFEEQSPEASGEICVAELFGHAIAPGRCGARIGVKAHNDPHLHNDMEDVALEIYATDWHTYSVEWLPDSIRFYVDDGLVRTVEQQINYELQLMLDFFEFPTHAERVETAYPKIAQVKAIRGYRRSCSLRANVPEAEPPRPGLPDG